jgi:predicted nuclease with TOPRIM domain
MADPTAIGAAVAAGLASLAQVVAAVKGGDREERIKALEVAQKTAGEEQKKLRDDLGNLAIRVDERSPAISTGQHPAIRDPLPSLPDRELEGRVRALESWRERLEGWREGVTAQMGRAIELAQEARDEMIRIVERVKSARDVRDRSAERGERRDSR